MRVPSIEESQTKRTVRNWTLTTDFYLVAAQDAMTHYGAPDIFNTDQGCQFTSQEFMGLLTQRHIAISMDDLGCRRDHVFVERLWGSVTYEEVYLIAVQDGFAPLQFHFQPLDSQGNGRG